MRSEMLSSGFGFWFSVMSTSLLVSPVVELEDAGVLPKRAIVCDGWWLVVGVEVEVVFVRVVEELCARWE